MKAQDNRQYLLDVALELFATQGYHSVGVQEIVSRAGVSKPTLYHYFGSKDGLLAAILESHFPALLEALQTGSRFEGDLVKALTGLFKSWFEQAQQRPHFMGLLLHLNYLPGQQHLVELLAPWQSQLQSVLLELFSQALPQHGNLRGHEQLLSSVLQGLLNHYALQSINGSLSLDDEMLYKAVKQYMYGIYVL